MSILKGFVWERIKVSEVSIGIENMQHEKTPNSFPPTLYFFFCLFEDRHVSD